MSNTQQYDSQHNSFAVGGYNCTEFEKHFRRDLKTPPIVPSEPSAPSAPKKTPTSPYHKPQFKKPDWAPPLTPLVPSEPSAGPHHKPHEKKTPIVPPSPTPAPPPGPSTPTGPTGPSGTVKIKKPKHPPSKYTPPPDYPAANPSDVKYNPYASPGKDKNVHVIDGIPATDEDYKMVNHLFDLWIKQGQKDITAFESMLEGI